MFLSVMWAMTAAMVGFSLGRVSMYGEPVYGEESEGEDGEREAAGSGRWNPLRLRKGRERPGLVRGKSRVRRGDGSEGRGTAHCDHTSRRR